MAVYFIRAGLSGPVKIGYAADPLLRMQAFQTCHYEKLTMVRLVEGGRSEEEIYHKIFSHLHIRGEWFHWAESMVDAQPIIPIGNISRKTDRPGNVGNADSLTNPMYFLERIVIDQGFKIREVAAEAGVAQSTISRWRTGETNPSHLIIEKIMNVMEAKKNQRIVAAAYERPAREVVG